MQQVHRSQTHVIYVIPCFEAGDGQREIGRGGICTVAAKCPRIAVQLFSEAVTRWQFQ